MRVVGVCVRVGGCVYVPHQDEYKQLWGRRIFVNDMESQIFTLDSTQTPLPLHHNHFANGAFLLVGSDGNLAAII